MTDAVMQFVGHAKAPFRTILLLRQYCGLSPCLGQQPIRRLPFPRYGQQ